MKLKSFCLIILLFISGLTLFAPVASAESWLDVFFPTAKKGPEPIETLKAPFADEDMVITEMDSLGNASNRTPLHLRHRTNDVIERWVQQIIPILISYKPNEYQQQFNTKITNFSKVGALEYKGFLQSANYITTLKAGRYDISGFVNSYPVILNEGTVDGSYSWVFQADTMITYQDRGSDYKYSKSKNSISKEYTITFQISRNRGSANEHGILIESWSVKPKKDN